MLSRTDAVVLARIPGCELYSAHRAPSLCAEVAQYADDFEHNGGARAGVCGAEAEGVTVVADDDLVSRIFEATDRPKDICDALLLDFVLFVGQIDCRRLVTVAREPFDVWNTTNPFFRKLLANALKRLDQVLRILPRQGQAWNLDQSWVLVFRHAVLLLRARFPRR